MEALRFYDADWRFSQRLMRYEHSAKKMSFSDDFAQWLKQSVFENETKLIRGYSFNLIEDGGNYFVELIGSEAFDETDPDWACDEQFEASPRSIAIPQEIHGSNWETCLSNMTNEANSYLSSGASVAKLLLAAEGIAIGFLDGDLHLIGKAEQEAAGQSATVE